MTGTETEDERALLAAYRALPETDRREFLGRMDERARVTLRSAPSTAKDSDASRGHTARVDDLQDQFEKDVDELHRGLASPETQQGDKKHRAG